jgi:MFS family permease
VPFLKVITYRNIIYWTEWLREPILSSGRKKMSRSIRLPKGMWPRRALATLFVVDGLGFGAWATHVPAFKQLLQLDNGSLTLILLSVVAGSIIATPLIGQCIARFGSRPVIRTVAIGYCVAIALLAQASNLTSLIVFACLFGATKGGFDVSVNAQAFAVEQHYGRSSMGFLQGCWGTGSLLGAAAAGLMLHHHGTTRADLSLTAGVLAICTLVVSPLLVGEQTPPQQGAKFVWPNASILKLAVLSFFGLLAEGAIADWAPVYLHSNIGVTLPLAAAGYTAYAVAMTAIRFSSDWLARRFSAQRILQASGLLIAAGMGCTLFAHSFALAAVGLVCTGMGIANIVPVIFGAAGRDTRMGPGPAISAVTTIGYCGLLAGPPMIGSLAMLAGLREAMGVIALAGLVVAAGPVFLAQEPVFQPVKADSVAA